MTDEIAVECISVAEAARILGVSQQVVRGRLRRGVFEHVTEGVLDGRTIRQTLLHAPEVRAMRRAKQSDGLGQEELPESFLGAEDRPAEYESIRAWAKYRGIPVAHTNPLPTALVKAYYSARPR